MPTIKEQVAANQARIAAGGETGTGVGPGSVQSPVTAAPTPPNDMPAGGGLPQRGMFPANLVLSSDRSDANRAFREAGVRSSTFPYAPTSTAVSTTIVEQAQASSGGSGAFSNLSSGPGIQITSKGKGFTISGIVGSLSMPSIFSVSGANPITDVNTSPIVVALVPENAFTAFMGPYQTGGQQETFDNATNSGDSAFDTTASLTFTPSTAQNEWGVFAIAAVTSVSGTPAYTAPSGWSQLQPTSGSDGQGLSWAMNMSVGQVATVGMSPGAAWAACGALFYAANTIPVVVQNKSTFPIGGITSTVTFTSNTTAGNSILVLIEYIGGSPFSFTSVTDSQNNKFKTLATHATNGGNVYCAIVYAENIVGGADTVTLVSNAGVGTQGVIWAIEMSGLTPFTAVPTFRDIMQYDLQFAVFGASGTNAAPGSVPSPGGVAGTTRYLREDATWATAVSILKTNGTLNGSQTTLNLAAGTDISVTDNGSGTVTIANTAPCGGVNAQTTNYTAVAGDQGKLISFNTSGGNFTEIQSNSAGSYSCAYTSTVTANNLLVAVSFGYNSGQTPSVTDTRGNTWHQIGTFQPRGGDTYGLIMYYTVNGSTGSNTVTISGLSSAFPGMWVMEFAGNATSSVLDGSSPSQGNGTTTSFSINVTTAGSNELVLAFAVVANGGGSVSSLDAGYTSVGQGGIGTNSAGIYEKFTSAGTYAAGGIQTVATGWAMTGAAFLPSAGLSLTLKLPATPPSSTWCIFVENAGSGTLTINPNGNQLDGSSGNLTGIQSNQGVFIATDGTNYFSERGLLPSASEIPAAGSSGDVQFNSGGFLGASANLFWDNTNNRLGIDTSSPLAPLDVNAAATGSTGLGIGNGTASTATAGADTLPASPAGFLVWYLAGTVIKIPYYNA